ncbi:histidine kinase N-terminal 7TM domain-containing protein [Mariniradius sediminis]|uniref:histidine kinase n=1 Tax=Mariniradius sediminis TaxID=2909237 RepID=A0ABS9BR23_9BACT|nr:histidine kinase N-terminal 7TM domain-containing protein [Mariniradius sediminis]MCF1750523.1 ATP-binding protein [Mariniradius sediminis]
MNLQFYFNPFAIPIFFTALVFLFLLRISFSKDFKLDDRYFTLLMLSCFLYSFFYAVELLGVNAETIRLFYYLEFIGGVFVAPFLFLFVLRYSDQTQLINKFLERLLFACSAFFLAMVLTNESHGLFYGSVSAQNNGYFLAVELEKGIFHWLYASYNSLLIIAANILLVRMLFSVPDLYKGQVLIMLFGTLIPWLAYILVVFGNYPFGLDPVPFFLAVSAIVLFWALYKYRLFRTNPIAFKTIFENISDGIIIFDRVGDVVALNLTAKKFFQDTGIQSPSNKSDLAKFQDDLSDLVNGTKATIEIEDKISEKSYVVYLRTINGEHPDGDNFQYLIIRDISEQKATEVLIKANEEKMQNVNMELLRKEKMLTSIAFATKELLSNQDFEIATQKAVTLIGDGAGADRAYLFENRIEENGNILSSQRFEWSALGVPPEINNPNLSDLPIGMFGEKVVGNFLQNNSFHGIVSQMDEDPELKELLQSQDILSILLIPIYVEDHFWGFVGFDDCTNERHWSDAETALLISFADSISNAIERKNLEKNLIYSMEQAKEASIAKSEFLANMSHEIRTPLNGVIGFSDLLMKTNLEDNQKGYLKSIIQSGNLLLGLINDILDFSKIEAGKLELSQDWINVRDVAAETLKIIQPVADEKKLQLKLNVDAEVPKFVQGDLTRIKQILINLLSNAGKFTHSGMIGLDISVDSQRSSPSRKALIFSVKDTGIGISKEKQQTIFEAFAQEDTSTTRKYGGTGLGLTICSKLLELMKSKLELETEVGQGSTFFFTLELPFAEQIEEPSLEVAQAIILEREEKETPASKGAYKVLLVDDNPVNMLLAKSIVKKLLPSSEISEAYNGAEAVAQYKRDVPDIIFMDIQMPEVSGYEATKQIRVIEKDRHTPIVALTAGTVKGEYDRCIEAGMDDYLSKPVLVSDIAGMIEKYLGSQPIEEQSQAISSKFDEYKKTDPEFFRELVEVSISNISKLKSALHSHFDQGDLKGVKQTGHALKGVGLNLDFQGLVQTAAEAERLTEITQSAASLVNATIEEANRILALLEKELK